MAPSMMPTTAPAAAAPSDAIQVTLSVPLFVRPSPCFSLPLIYLYLSLFAPDAIQAAMAATLGTIQLPTSVPPPTTVTAPAEAPPAKGFNEMNNNSNGITMTTKATGATMPTTNTITGQ